jgi:hypothetical protein
VKAIEQTHLKISAVETELASQVYSGLKQVTTVQEISVFCVYALFLNLISLAGTYQIRVAETKFFIHQLMHK